ncbi:MAG: hypothetical protein JXA90_01865 [Planctomycetes bacterium]|nr:hypothetical protein [Planctomycetota bacterium]
MSLFDDARWVDESGEAWGGPVHEPSDGSGGSLVPEGPLAAARPAGSDAFLGVLRKMASWSRLMGDAEESLESCSGFPPWALAPACDLQRFRRPTITLESLDGFIHGERP